MKTIVISLPASVKRRKIMRSQLDPIDADYCFFDAIDVRTNRKKYFRYYDQERFFLNTGRAASTGEVGCYASHLMVWKACVASDRPIVVLEDDARIDEAYPEALALAEKHIARLGFIRLENNKKCSGKTVANAKHFMIRYCNKYPFGATAYAISPAVARVFIDSSEVLYAPIDKFIKNFWEHGQPLYNLLPPVVSDGECGPESTIGVRRQPLYTARQRYLRLRQKFLELVRRLAFNLVYAIGRALSDRPPHPGIAIAASKLRRTL